MSGLQGTSGQGTYAIYPQRSGSDRDSVKQFCKLENLDSILESLKDANQARLKNGSSIG